MHLFDGFDKDLLRFEVLETCFNSVHGPLGYFPQESYEQWAARYFHPFRRTATGWERDFEGMNAAALEAGYNGYEGWSNAKRQQARELKPRWHADDREEQRLFETMRHLQPFVVHMAQSNCTPCDLPFKTNAFDSQLSFLVPSFSAMLEEAPMLEEAKEAILCAEIIKARKNSQLQLEKRKQSALLKKERKEAKDKAEKDELRKQKEEDELLNEAIKMNEAKKDSCRRPGSASSVDTSSTHSASGSSTFDKSLLLKSLKDAEELRIKADLDLKSLIHGPKVLLQIDGCASIPPALALYSLLHTGIARQKLMINTLYFFERWTRVAALPPYSVFRTLFLASECSEDRIYPPLYISAEKTKGAFRIIQAVRNIVGIVFDLRRILTSGVATFAAEYHSHFQILVGVCNQRQFSLSVLEGISLLGESTELLELYKSFENFENFIQGSDFVVFRECFKLFPMPDLSHFSELVDHSGLADLFLHHAFQASPFSELNVHEVVGKVMFSWNDESAARNYYDSLKPTVKIVLKVWGKLLEKCALWNSSPPSLHSLNSTPEFEAFLSSLFGSPANFQAQFNSGMWN